MTRLHWFLLENVLRTVFIKEREDILACIPLPREIPVSERNFHFCMAGGLYSV